MLVVPRVFAKPTIGLLSATRRFRYRRRRNVVLVELGVGSIGNTVGTPGQREAEGEDETKIPFDSCRLIFERKPPRLISAVLARRMLGHVA